MRSSAWEVMSLAAPCSAYSLVIMVVAVVVVDLEVEEVGFAKRMADEELSRQDISLTVFAGADGRGGEYGRGILCRQERQTLGHAVVHQFCHAAISHAPVWREVAGQEKGFSAAAERCFGAK